MKKKVIVIQTDFGTRDHYVAAMKGSMLSIHGDLLFIDLSHDIPPFTTISASYQLYAVWEYFPEKSVFLSVVDPGVGTTRRTIVAKIRGRYLVAPDNGTVSMLVRMFPESILFRPQEKVTENLSRDASRTFHGRDIFAPLAAMIACNGFNSVRGRRCEGIVLPGIFPRIDAESHTITGTVIHVDRFGNCITSVHVSDIEAAGITISPVFSFSGKTISTLSRTFSDVPPGSPLVYEGSSGFYEIAVREGNAAVLLGVNIGDEVGVRKRQG